MSHYEKKPEDLAQDTKDFLKSDYGQYIVSILVETGEGHLSHVADIKTRYPERYAAKYSAYKEIIDLIHQPLDDDIPTHG